MSNRILPYLGEPLAHVAGTCRSGGRGGRKEEKKKLQRIKIRLIPAQLSLLLAPVTAARTRQLLILTLQSPKKSPTGVQWSRSLASSLELFHHRVLTDLTCVFYLNFVLLLLLVAITGLNLFIACVVTYLIYFDSLVFLRCSFFLRHGHLLMVFFLCMKSGSIVGYS